MTQIEFTVEGRQFRTRSDYALARRDKEIIDRLRRERNLKDKRELDKLRSELRSGRYKFQTLLGQDFLEEVEELLKAAGAEGSGSGGRTAKTGSKKWQSSWSASVSGRQTGHSARNTSALDKKSEKDSAAMEAYVQEELKKREKRRKLTIIMCSVAAACCLGYFGVYSYFNYRTDNTYQELSELRERPVSNEAPAEPEPPLFTLDSAPEEKEVLEEFKNLLNKNKKLIGWLKIDDTNIDYPVMQTTDNEYYLDHNLDQEYDRNGSIFMDKDCDVLKPSTNYILYGHHMKSGKMFGKLHLYQEESYYEEHPYIQFDTIYEKGLYQVMYVFRSRVYKEDEIVFKYYQFIDANSEQEFDSYMKEMADMSFYDTGVTAKYGDQLLTLSTCDYEEEDGRFVVVAKKIAKE